jgi:hypothetical protein
MNILREAAAKAGIVVHEGPDAVPTPSPPRTSPPPKTSPASPCSSPEYEPWELLSATLARSPPAPATPAQPRPKAGDLVADPGDSWERLAQALQGGESSRPARSRSPARTPKSRDLMLGRELPLKACGPGTGYFVAQTCASPADVMPAAPLRVGSPLATTPEQSPPRPIPPSGSPPPHLLPSSSTGADSSMPRGGLLRTIETVHAPTDGTPMRLRPGNENGHRFGARGGKNNPNVQWFSMRAKAKAGGWYAYFVANYPKPTK